MNDGLRRYVFGGPGHVLLGNAVETDPFTCAVKMFREVYGEEEVILVSGYVGTKEDMNVRLLPAVQERAVDIEVVFDVTPPIPDDCCSPNVESSDG